jgi:hypothetical protein
MIDDFLAEVFQGLEPGPAHAQRWAAAWDLPDDPSPEQVGAWVELAGLVSDRDFRRRTRQVTERGIQLQASGLEDLADWATQHAVAALLRGCPPDSAEAATVVNRILEPKGWSTRREELLAGLEMLFDPRIERYWQLTAIINGLPPYPTYAPAVRSSRSAIFASLASSSIRSRSFASRSRPFSARSASVSWGTPAPARGHSTAAVSDLAGCPGCC